MAKQNNEGGVIKQIEVKLEDIFVKKLPALPTSIKEIIVRFSPWIALVALVFSLPTLLGALGLSALMMPGWGYSYRFGYNIAWWISVASMVLLAVALPGLFKRKISAWRLMFYSGLIMAIYNLVTVNLGGLIIGTGISMYILFQIKGHYK
ncbi:MAG: hypothetical protein WA052_00890 [Microgenomates group bacterium]